MKMTVIYQAPFAETCMGFRLGAAYRPVWMEPNENGDSVDEIWTRFQRIDFPDMMPPEGYRGRSLSIGDVVGTGEEMYTPETFGWRELDQEERREVLMSSARLLGVNIETIDAS
jgi:hypothetical protein